MAPAVRDRDPLRSKVPEETRDKAAFHLALGKTKQEVAALVGVHRNTITLWTSQHDFQVKVTALQEEAHEAAKNGLLGAVSDAVQALVAVLKNDGARDADRIKAACEVLDRVGFVPKQRIELSTPAVEDEDLAAWLQRKAALLGVDPGEE